MAALYNRTSRFSNEIYPLIYYFPMGFEKIISKGKRNGVSSVERCLTCQTSIWEKK